jgi:hypothetical protein
MADLHQADLHQSVQIAGLLVILVSLAMIEPGDIAAEIL